MILPNGIELDPKGGWAEGITRCARSNGFTNIHGFLATHPDGQKEYVLVEYNKDGKEGEVIYAHTGFEDVCCHLNILRLAREKT